MRARAAGVVLLVCVIAPGCSRAQRSSPAPTTAGVIAHGERLISGKATLDGKQFDARFLGAVVQRDGLVTPCQANVSAVFAGDYEIAVVPSDDSAGCGAPGSRVLLWTFVGNTKLYATTSLPWPASSTRARFDARFTRAHPNGAAPTLTELSGEVRDRSGRSVPLGTRVEALVGTTRCGVASVHRFADTFTGYAMTVVGPDSIAACSRGARITFRIGGRPAREHALNRLAPAAPGSGGSFPLTVA